MAKLTKEQLAFLDLHDIPLSRVFDASGMAPRDYMPVMRQLELWVAYGVTPCRTAGHTLRERAGHCVQCRTGNLAYLCRHDLPGYVYVAHSVSGGLVKVGSTTDLATRVKHLISYRYGERRDWRLAWKIQSERAGKVEVQAHGLLEQYFADNLFYVDRREIKCRELFRCDVQSAIEAVMRAVQEVCGKAPPTYRAVQHVCSMDESKGKATVLQLATELKMPAEALLAQLAKAGVSKKTPRESLSYEDKAKLLDYLRRSHGEAETKTKTTLTRKPSVAVTIDAKRGVSTEHVEVRKKRILVKRADATPPVLLSGQSQKKVQKPNSIWFPGVHREVAKPPSLVTNSPMRGKQVPLSPEQERAKKELEALEREEERGLIDTHFDMAGMLKGEH